MHGPGGTKGNPTRGEVLLIAVEGCMKRGAPPRRERERRGGDGHATTVS